MSQKLFAVYLGGRAPKCNTELHDVVFAIGDTIEATYEQLLERWFGTPERLHLDSWMELGVVDGFKVTVTDKKPANDKKLYFLNVGAYADGQFTEVHATAFIVAESKLEAKSQGKSRLLKNWPSPVHTDDLHDLDDCLEIGKVGSHYIALEKTDERRALTPVNGYHIVPKSAVRDYINRKSGQMTLALQG